MLLLIILIFIHLNNIFYDSSLYKDKLYLFIDELRNKYFL